MTIPIKVITAKDFKKKISSEVRTTDVWRVEIVAIRAQP